MHETDVSVRVGAKGMQCMGTTRTCVQILVVVQSKEKEEKEKMMREQAIQMHKKEEIRGPEL